jgi:hypothetical protein
MSENAFQELKNRSTFARLKRLFSNDVIVRNVGGKKLKIIDTDEVQYATDRNSFRDRFNRMLTSSPNQISTDFNIAYHSNRNELFRDYDCVGPDTIIPLPDGSNPTIAELTEKYKDDPQKRFHVFSYDEESDSIKLGNAYHPRKKGRREAWKVTLDSGQSVVGSAKHPFLMRNGEYKVIKDLTVGESVMPFYQTPYFNQTHGYRRLYNFSKGWQSEHQIVAEQFSGREVLKSECVHHINFTPSDNSAVNLKIMDKGDHKEFHANHSKNVLWGKDNYEIQLNKLKSHPNYINRNFHKWDGEREGDKNPFYGKTHTSESNEKRSTTLKEVFKDRDQSGEKNPGYRSDLTIDVLKVKASDHYRDNGNLKAWDLVKTLGCDYSVLQSRIKNSEYKNWNSFKKEVTSTLNHKITSIEFIGEIDVYDVTVEHFANFATDSCFLHNTMDMDPILSSALDIYADECTSKNELGDILTIKSSNDEVRDVLHNLFYDILNIEFNLWSWTRSLVKYGDFYLRLHISPEYGVYLVEPLSTYYVQRIENSDLTNRNYVKFNVTLPQGNKIDDLDNFQMAHFRLLSDSNFLPYGKSSLEGARRVWKQLSLMEDAMLIHRIMRAPEKRIFKVDIGNIPPNEVDNHMERIVTQMKKVPYIDDSTGDYNLKFNLQNMVEDFFLPVRGGDSGTSIENLSGLEWTGTDDIEYLRNKMMAALKIPKAFLGYEEGISGKATLAAEDIRFARTIQRIQRIMVSELNKIAVVHLYSQGHRDEALVDFTLELTNPSTIFEKEKIEVWKSKVELSKDMQETKLFSKKWLYENVFNLPEQTIIEIQKELVDDSKGMFRFTQIEEEGKDPALEFLKGGDAPEPGGEEGGDEEGEDGPGDDAGPPDEPELNEKSNKPRDQTGRKKASDYTFGEDPLGTLENNRETPLSPSHRFSKNSPLSLDELMTGLDEHKRKMINEGEADEPTKENSASYMDEVNIPE